MIKLLVSFGFVLLALNISATSCEEIPNGETYGSMYQLRAYEELMRGVSKELYGPERGLGLSAWGIIIVVVLIILAIVGMYYISICYPLFCKKPRNYDVMELPKPV